MPVYEYKCKACGAVSEVLRPFASRSEALACAECDAPTEPILSRFNVLRSNQVSGRERASEGEVRHGRRSAAMRFENSTGVVVENSTISGCETGISLDTKTSIAMDGNRFLNVAKPIEVADW